MVPSLMAMGCGVRMEKHNSGGVILSRFDVSAKKGKTFSGFNDRFIDVLRICALISDSFLKRQGRLPVFLLFILS